MFGTALTLRKSAEYIRSKDHFVPSYAQPGLPNPGIGARFSLVIRSSLLREVGPRGGSYVEAFGRENEYQA